MMTLTELDRWLRDLLRFDLSESVDAGRNGVQVARRKQEVNKIAFAVDASRETARRAAEWGADVLFVHHGLFWDQPLVLAGTLYERVRMLMESDIALYAVHLPLDMHPEVGNNAGIARHLELREIEPFGDHRGVKIGCKGSLGQPMRLEEIVRRLTGSDATAARSLPFGPEMVRRIGIVSGDAVKDVRQAIREGLDLFITGEASHTVYHDCLEAGIHAIFAGHYYTETFGVRLLREKTARETGLETKYLDLPTGL
jgi:dinuclear metal center YbgI/SA1388 family protein